MILNNTTIWMGNFTFFLLKVLFLLILSINSQKVTLPYLLCQKMKNINIEILIIF